MSDDEGKGKKGKEPMLDFTGGDPKDAELYQQMPPPGDDEEVPEPDEWVDILGSGRLKKKVWGPALHTFAKRMDVHQCRRAGSQLMGHVTIPPAVLDPS